MFCASSSALRLMPLGDSITFGCGDDYSPTCLAEGATLQPTCFGVPCAECNHGYRLRLFERLRCVAPGRFIFVGSQTNPVATSCPMPGACDHEGRSGYQTEQLAEMLDTIAQSRPDVILVMIGTNNLGFTAYATADEAAATLAAKLDGLIAGIFSVLPDVHVFLASILSMPDQYMFYTIPRTAGINLTEYAEAYSARISELADHYSKAGADLTFVDMARKARICGPFADGCCIDTLHPSGSGYDLIAATWFGALAPRYFPESNLSGCPLAGGPSMEVSAAVPPAPDGAAIAATVAVANASISPSGTTQAGADSRRPSTVVATSASTSVPRPAVTGPRPSAPKAQTPSSSLSAQQMSTSPLALRVRPYCLSLVLLMLSAT